MEEIKNHSIFTSQRFWIFLCVFITFGVMAPNINNGWVNWDDENFILNNPLVEHITSENVKKVFTTLENNGGYTPLVVLSWSLDYSADGFNAQVFHTTNILLHLINVSLVFILILSLTQRIELAVIVALLFGIHPMQLEAVAWITSRKDLLYGLFYLAGLITYLKYLKNENGHRRKLYLLCLLFFAGSLLSKGMAVTFPVTLLIIDQFMKRKNLRLLIIEKIPFLVLSIIVGLIAVSAQQQGGAIGEMENISFVDSFFVACYGLVVYVFKAIIPMNLSSYHPYPYALGESLPFYFYGALIPAIMVVIATYLAWKKNRFLAFGAFFFLASLLLILQFFPVGLAIISERFSYIAYIGLFFLLAYSVLFLSDRYGLRRQSVYFGFAGYLILLGMVTYERSDIWENSESLWSDVIDKYPDDFRAYANRAAYYLSIGELEMALNDFDSAIIRDPNSFKLFSNRGLLLLQLGEREKALEDFQKSISINPKFIDAYINRGILFMQNGMYAKAQNDFDYSIELDSASFLSYYNRGQLNEKVRRFEDAIKDYSKALSLDEENTMLLADRADLYLVMGMTELAKKDYERCIEIDRDFMFAYFELGRIYLSEQNLDMALPQFVRVKTLDSNFAPAYVNLGLIYLNQKEYAIALEELNKGIVLDSDEPMGYFNRGLVYHFTNNQTKAISDFSACITRIPDYGPAFYWRSVCFLSIGQETDALKDALKAQDLNFVLPVGYIESISSISRR